MARGRSSGYGAGMPLFPLDLTDLVSPYARDEPADCNRTIERLRAERNAMIDAPEEGRLVALADELDEDNRATDARLLRAALAELGRYRTAAK